jgi:hypothetical protein
MENDRRTIPEEINIVFESNEKYLAHLKQCADDDNQNDEEDSNMLSITSEGHSVTPSEIYLEEGKLYVSCNMVSKQGSTWVSMKIPLSQEVLFDILGDSIKKFNKVKTVFEATK